SAEDNRRSVSHTTLPYLPLIVPLDGHKGPEETQIEPFVEKTDNTSRFLGPSPTPSGPPLAPQSHETYRALIDDDANFNVSARPICFYFSCKLTVFGRVFPQKHC